MKTPYHVILLTICTLRTWKWKFYNTNSHKSHKTATQINLKRNLPKSGSVSRAMCRECRSIGLLNFSFTLAVNTEMSVIVFFNEHILLENELSKRPEISSGATLPVMMILMISTTKAGISLGCTVSTPGARAFSANIIPIVIIYTGEG